MSLLATNVADYWVVGKGKAKNFRPQDGVNWAGVIAWALGAIISYHSLLKIEFVGIIIGFVIYLIAERFIPSASRDNAKI